MKTNRDGAYSLLDGLAKLGPDVLLTAKMLASAMGVDIRTVTRMVDRCNLPMPFKIGRTRYWKAGRVRAWFDRLADEGERVTAQRLKKIQDFA